jgi:hypothetical protein
MKMYSCCRGYDRERLLWLAVRFNAREIVVSGRFNAGYSYFTAVRQDYSASSFHHRRLPFLRLDTPPPPPPLGGSGKLLPAYQGDLHRLAVCKGGASARVTWSGAARVSDWYSAARVE